jgi:hypothetical protein
MFGALALAGASLHARQSPPSDPELSKDHQHALDEAFDKWEAGSVDPQAVACRRDAGVPAAQTRGDFNNDGQPDVAMLVKAADGVHLTVIFARVTESVAVDVDRLGTAAADGWLTVEPRGSGYLNTADGLEDFFSADTIVVSRCGQPRTAYFWSGLDFRKRQLADEVVTGPGAGGAPGQPVSRFAGAPTGRRLAGIAPAPSGS